MSSFMEYLKNVGTSRGFSETKGGEVYNEAMQNLVDVMKKPDGVSLTSFFPYNLIADGLRAVQGLGPAYEAAVGGTTGVLSNELEKLGMSENSSDRLNRDLLALGLEAPVDMFVAPYAGVAAKAGEYANMVKKARPYLMGELLEKNPDVKMLPKEGKPAAVKIDGERYSSREIAEIKVAEEKYIKDLGLEVPDYFRYPDQDATRAKLIAAAYEKMKNNPTDPDVKKSYDALIEETLAQYKLLENKGINFNFLKDGMADPYAASPAMGYKDLVENKSLTVFPTDFGYGSNPSFDASANPMLTKVGRIGDKEDAVANDAFRVVHDVYGHMGSGNPQFRNKGEERAWLQHSRMYTPEAKGAMTSETRGQNSWVNFGPNASQNRTASGADTIYADQKVGLMPDWTYDPEGMPDGLELKELEEIIRTWGD